MTARQTLTALDFPNGMTVAELKAMVRGWPETDEYGEPCEVWLGDSNGLSNQVIAATPLNMRRSEDGSKLWADFMLEHGAGLQEQSNGDCSPRVLSNDECAELRGALWNCMYSTINSNKAIRKWYAALQEQSR